MNEQAAQIEQGVAVEQAKQVKSRLRPLRPMRLAAFSLATPLLPFAVEAAPIAVSPLLLRVTLVIAPALLYYGAV